MNVSEQIKTAYKNNSHAKILSVAFPDAEYTVPTDEVYYESMTLEEAIFDEDSFEAVGCIASQFNISIRDSGLNLKDELMTVSISLDGIANSTIPLFYGYVDSVEREAQKKMQKIVAYDPLYSISNVDVKDWYNALTFPITLKDFRDSLFTRLDIAQVETELPCDDIEINKEFSPKELNALGVIKALCQLNGCFGIMNREGEFEYRYLITPNQEGAVPETVSYYRSMKYSDYTVNPIDKLTIRQSSSEAGITIGTGDNEYIIQGNMFTYNLSPETIYDIAYAIYPYLNDIEYIPFEASNNGYPWIEMGDNCCLSYSVYDFDNSTSSTEVYKDVTVVAMKRTMKGIQNLIDSYSAEGNELQREFVSESSLDLEALQQTVDDIVNYLSNDLATYRNTSAITISEGQSVDIADFTYKSEEGNTVIFHEEANLEVEAVETEANDIYTENDVKATIRYYVNGYQLPTHKSEGLIREGTHILSLMQFWTAGVAKTNRCQAKLTLTGGSAVIRKFMAQAYVSIKQTPYNETDIEVAHNPNKTVYKIEEPIDFTGLVVNKVYSDGGSTIREDITSQCTYSPVEGTVFHEETTVTVQVHYEETTELGDRKVYTTEFYLTIEPIVLDLKYLAYDIDASKGVIYYSGINTDEVIQDNLSTLIIPDTYTDSNTGVTYKLILRRNW